MRKAVCFMVYGARYARHHPPTCSPPRTLFMLMQCLGILDRIIGQGHRPLPLLEGSVSATNWGKMPTGSSGSSYKVGSRGKKHESVRDVCSFGGQFLLLHSFFKCRGRSENENFIFDVFIFATTH